MKKQLSIIIPTYNMEDYLDRCLKSVLDKDALNEIEVIVVNDGSKDNSLNIAYSYKEAFGDSLVIVDKENGNYGSCINAGLEIAVGRYLQILDADDYVNTASFKSVVGKLKGIDADMVVMNYTCKYIKQKRDVIRNAAGVEYEKEYQQSEIDFKALGMHFMYSKHSNIFKTALFKENEIQIQPKVCYTDTEFCFLPFWYVNTIVFFKENVYNYILERDGQTVEFSAYYKNRDHLRKVLLRLMDDFSAHKSASRSVQMLDNQRIHLLGLMNMYYLAILASPLASKSEQGELKCFDKSIKQFDKQLYNMSFNVKWHHVRYIEEWRNKGKYPEWKVRVHTFRDLFLDTIRKPFRGKMEKLP